MDNIQPFPQKACVLPVQQDMTIKNSLTDTKKLFWAQFQIRTIQDEPIS